MIKINIPVFKKIDSFGAKLVAVTKYYNSEETAQIIDFGTQFFPKSFWGIGENRIKTLKEKNLSQISEEKIHFIGNLQSRDFRFFQNIGIIHSLCHLNHAEKLEKLGKQWGKIFSVFLEVKITKDPQKIGLSEEELEILIPQLKPLNHLKIMGISGMGASEWSIREKIDEMKVLKHLRDEYIPKGKISAGTSQDFEIALEEGIDIVRVGKALVEE